MLFALGENNFRAEPYAQEMCAGFFGGHQEELEEDEDKLTNGPGADHTDSSRHVGVVVSL